MRFVPVAARRCAGRKDESASVDVDISREEADAVGLGGGLRAAHERVEHGRRGIGPGMVEHGICVIVHKGDGDDAMLAFVEPVASWADSSG